MRVGRIASWCLSAFMLSFSIGASAAPIGLVLSGGGAKGAYEVGVWQALQVAGLASNVTAISGTSVGAINAALFATKPELAEELWLEKVADIFSINTNRVGESIQKTLDDASNAVVVAEKTGEDWKGVASFLLNSLVRIADDYVRMKMTRESRVGYIDSSKLATALDETLPRTWHREWPAVYATAVEKGGGGISKTWRLNDEPHERRVLMLQASAAVPFGFDTVSIDGKSYVDGGWEDEGGDSTPLRPILENHPDIKTVIIVYLKHKKKIDLKRRTENKRAADAKGVRLLEIIPRDGKLFGICDLVDTSPENARARIALGRKDARKALAEAGFASGGR